MRKAVVLGGCGGLGKAIVRRLLDTGDFVYVLDLESARADFESEFGASCSSHSPRSAFMPCDLGDPASLHAAFAAIDLAGPAIPPHDGARQYENNGEEQDEGSEGEVATIDVFVNAAGAIRRGGFLDTCEADLNAMVAINLSGVYLALQQAARRMRPHGGRIVNIASVHGLRTTSERALYSMCKGAVLALTRALAVELAEHRILVNAVAPGPVSAGMQDAASEARSAWTDATPLGRVARADEVATAVEFLASARNTFITGEILVVDGGASAAIGRAIRGNPAL